MQDDTPDSNDRLGGRGGAHSILFVGTYYPAFLLDHYRRSPDLLQATYAVQLKSLLDSSFGDSDFYSRGMQIQGWRATDVIANCIPLQKAWADERGFPGQDLAILLEQIRVERPDVVYFQDLSLCTAEFIAMVRPHARLLAGQIASPVPPQTHLAGLDLLISSFPHFVRKWRQEGLCAYYQPLAFDARILERVGPRQLSIPFSFVGGISPDHGKGTELLDALAAGTNLELWGYGAQTLRPDSPVRARHHGEVWGLDMFRLLRSSGLTLNRHIDAAEHYANNMRLFEATGCGALLLTDQRDNLQELFRIGEEVIAYRSAAEAVNLVNYFQRQPAEAAAIAAAGQARTLQDHSYLNRMGQTAEHLERHLRYGKEAAFFPPLDLESVSQGYENLHPANVTETLGSAWQAPAIPDRQRALVQLQLADLYRGQVQPIFQVLADLLEPIVQNQGLILEIGCASGYYKEILEYLLNRELSYVGVDYSLPLITMARSYYPRTRFEVADGAALPFPDRSFPCVISSCVLLCTPHWHAHVEETARVAGEYVVAHRTPICRDRPTQYQKKRAYGVETLELRFNEADFLNAFLGQDFALERAETFEQQPDRDAYETSFLFRRRPGKGSPRSGARA